MSICQDTTRKWRRRYCEQGIEGLADAPRPGRPRVFSARIVAGVKALACEMPTSSGTPLARWTCPELARHAATSGIALDLYQREWEGKPLDEDEYVLSADEKPGVQARMRIHLPLPPGTGRAMRIESEYHRLGTLAYLAAYDVHRAQVMGRCEPTTGIRPFTALVDQVMQSEPYASARRVFWVVDNGSSHRNWAAAARLSDAYPNAQMVHLPVHASWLNQIEVYFSVIQRKLLAPDDFEDLDELAAQVLAFENHYNAAARPFDWKFTRPDLNRLLARIRQHDRHAPHPLAG
ncbi:helix-turn-helix domain-containing protein [Streptosporangium sp. NPDC048865]|uniref:helix-turn-helix domain-containing protein n=1 Tax=Streptosporangium sp. NPDC048865 TaxID=3155766 RepID=UPI003442966A